MSWLPSLDDVCAFEPFTFFDESPSTFAHCTVPMGRVGGDFIFKSATLTETGLPANGWELSPGVTCDSKFPIVCRSQAFDGAQKTASIFEKKFGLNCTAAENRLYICLDEKARKKAFDFFNKDVVRRYFGSSYVVKDYTVVAKSDEYLVTHVVGKEGVFEPTIMNTFSIDKVIKLLISSFDAT